jgi:hypothetical protein
MGLFYFLSSKKRFEATLKEANQQKGRGKNQDALKILDE